MTTPIYVVRGQTGEYSDRAEWLVRAFASEQAAGELVAKLRELCGAAWSGEHAVGPDYAECGKVGKRIRASGLDPEASVDYTGIDYDIVAVPFEVSQ